MRTPHLLCPFLSADEVVRLAGRNPQTQAKRARELALRDKRERKREKKAEAAARRAEAATEAATAASDEPTALEAEDAPAT